MLLVRYEKDEGEELPAGLELVDALLSTDANDLVTTLQGVLAHVLTELPRSPTMQIFFMRSLLSFYVRSLAAGGTPCARRRVRFTHAFSFGRLPFLALFVCIFAWHGGEPREF